MVDFPTFNSPFMLGFDELENMLCQVSKRTDSFPPYNIEQLDKNTLEITLAVAGYEEADLEITQEDNQLFIRGHKEKNPAQHFLHQGIAYRTFVKSFVLADGLTITGAMLQNGLLAIRLKRPERQTAVRRIAIETEAHMPQVLKGKKLK